MFWLSMRRGCGSWTPKMFRLFPVLRLVILLVPGWPERVLADACTLAGGPLPMEGALRLGGGRLDAYRVPVLRMRRRLKICLDIAGALVTHGFSVFRAQELSVRWQVVLDQGPVGPLVQVAYLGSGGLQEFHTWVVTLCNLVVEFIRKVVSNRKEHHVRAWRTLVLEDKSSHPYRWLRPDFVPLSPIRAIQDPSGGKRQVVFTNPAGI